MGIADTQITIDPWSSPRFDIDFIWEGDDFYIRMAVDILEMLLFLTNQTQNGTEEVAT